MHARWIRNTFVIALFLCLTGVLSWGFQRFYNHDRSDFFLIKVGNPVPNFAVEGLDKKIHHLNDFKDQDVVIHFWATWCPPCLVELPKIIETASRDPHRIFIAISSDKNPFAIDRFFEKKHPALPDNFIVVYDAGQIITQEKFGVFQLPETFLLDKDHILQKHISGVYDDWDKF